MFHGLPKLSNTSLVSLILQYRRKNNNTNIYLLSFSDHSLPRLPYEHQVWRVVIQSKAFFPYLPFFYTSDSLIWLTCYFHVSPIGQIVWGKCRWINLRYLSDKKQSIHFRTYRNLPSFRVVLLVSWCNGVISLRPSTYSGTTSALRHSRIQCYGKGVFIILPYFLTQLRVHSTLLIGETLQLESSG